MKKKIVKWLVRKYRHSNEQFRSIIRDLIKRLDNGSLESRYLREIFKKYHNVEIGMYSYGGCFNPGLINPGSVFGKYCSVAHQVCVFNRNHPAQYITTHPILFNTNLGVVREEILPYDKTIIGHDVWIGYGAKIMPSTTKIGNGAIIGAGAVVTKNVPPYAIVLGVPGTVKKYRFEPEHIAILEKSEWWNWDHQFIIKNKDSFYDIQKFINLLENI